MAVYAASALFHTRETIFSERADYFMPVIAFMGQFVWAVMCVSPFARRNALLTLPALVLPLVAFALFFMYTMHYIKFDYGWQNRVVGGLLALQLLVWMPWQVENMAERVWSTMCWQAEC